MKRIYYIFVRVKFSFPKGFRDKQKVSKQFSSFQCSLFVVGEKFKVREFSDLSTVHLKRYS